MAVACTCAILGVLVGAAVDKQSHHSMESSSRGASTFTPGVNPPPGMPGVTTNAGIWPQFGPWTHNDPVIKNTPNGVNTAIQQRGVTFMSNPNDIYTGNPVRILSGKPGKTEKISSDYFNYHRDPVVPVHTLKRVGNRPNVTVQVKPTQYDTDHLVKGAQSEYINEKATRA